MIHLLMELLGNWGRFRRWSLIEATSHQLSDFVWCLAPGLFMSLSRCPLATVNLAFSFHYAFYPTMFCLTTACQHWNYLTVDWSIQTLNQTKCTVLQSILSHIVVTVRKFRLTYLILFYFTYFQCSRLSTRTVHAQCN